MPEAQPGSTFADSNRAVADLYAAGSRASALRLAERVLADAEPVLGPEHSVVNEAMNNLATILDSLGDFERARPLYERVIAGLRAAPADEPNLTVVLTSLAVGYSSVGDYASGVPLVQEALDIRSRLYGPHDRWTARSRQTLAGLYGAMGEFDRAATIFPEPTGWPADLPDIPPSLAAILTTEARRFDLEGKLGAARPLYEQAVASARRTFGDEHPLVAAMWNNLGLAAQADGDLMTAMADLERAAAVLERGPADELLAQVLNNRGWTRVLAGDFREAAADLEHALAIRRSVLGPADVKNAETLNNLGLLRYATGDPNAALDLLEQAAEIVARSPVADAKLLADTYNNLGLVYRMVGDDAEAEVCHAKALKHRQEALGPRHPDVAQSLNNLSVLWWSQGRLDEAADAANRALLLRRELWGERHPDVAQSLNNVAVIEAARGSHGLAVELAQRSAAGFEESLGPDHPSVVPPLLNAAVSLMEVGRHRDALATLLRAAKVEDAVIATVIPVATEEQRRRVVNIADRTVQVALHLMLYGEDLGSDAVDRVLDVVLSRKGLAAEAAAAQREAGLSLRYPDVAPILRDLTDLRARIAAEMLAGRGRTSGGTAATEAWSRYEELERQLAHKVPDIELARRTRSATAESVAAALPADAVLVEILRYEPERLGGWLEGSALYLAFVVRPGASSPAELVVLGDADHIDAMVDDFRATVAGAAGRSLAGDVLTAGGEDVVFENVGVDLRSAVLDPLTALLGGRTRLFIAPDGNLSRLPFDVLPNGTGFVIDELEIAYLTAGRDLLRQLDSGYPPLSPPMVVADPDFDLAGTDQPDRSPMSGKAAADLRAYAPHFLPLPATGEEGLRVAAVLGVEPLLGRQALDPAVRNARAPSVLHLATHGFFLADRRTTAADTRADTRAANGLGTPEELGAATRFDLLGRAGNPMLRSGLAFSGVNTWLAGAHVDLRAEDGLLTADDVCGMDLLGTQLVVLSACDTGLGEVQSGEAVQGLRRAFIEAGARTVVMSLWKVPDRETMQLMVHFHELLSKGEPCGSALRSARLHIRRSSPDPASWGAFICLGDPGQVVGAGSAASSASRATSA